MKQEELEALVRDIHRLCVKYDVILDYAEGEHETDIVVRPVSREPGSMLPGVNLTFVDTAERDVSVWGPAIG